MSLDMPVEQQIDTPEEGNMDFIIENTAEGNMDPCSPRGTWISRGNMTCVSLVLTNQK